MIQSARQVEQFSSGVFVGVPPAIERPTFRDGGLWTEDEEAADLGDAAIELRAFDTSYWSVAAAEPDLIDAIRERMRARYATES